MSYADFSERGRNGICARALGRGRGCGWAGGRRVRTSAQVRDRYARDKDAGACVNHAGLGTLPTSPPLVAWLALVADVIRLAAGTLVVAAWLLDVAMLRHPTTTPTTPCSSHA